jgi:RNA polymerase sigma-70 factor (ECF subfamily)
LTSNSRSAALGGRARGRGEARDADVLREVVDGARSGDPAARADLFDRYHTAVYRYAVARVGSPTDAEDVVAETFLSALSALPRFRWQGVPFEAWLFRIAASKVVDVGRRRQRGMVPLDAAGVDPTDEAADPGGRLDRAERQAELAAALDGLPATQRDVLVLRFLLGHTVQEVARAMDRTEGAVKQLQVRALANLRKTVDR